MLDCLRFKARHLFFKKMNPDNQNPVVQPDSVTTAPTPGPEQPPQPVVSPSPQPSPIPTNNAGPVQYGQTQSPISSGGRSFSVKFILAIALAILLLGGAGWLIAKRTSKPNPVKSLAGSSITWRDPAVTSEITAAGQKIVSSKQVKVSAGVDWVDTSLQVAAGQHIWLTTNAKDKWSGNPQLFPYSDANGLSAYPGGYKIDAHANVLSLIGFVGSEPPTVPQQNIPVGMSGGGPGGISDPGFFEPGNTLKNYSPAALGEIWLRNNDNTNFESDLGQQTAAVWVTSN